MALKIERAVFESIPLRAEIEGGTGAGKTMTAIMIMDDMVKELKKLNQLTGNGEFLVGDSEKESSKRFARKRDGSGWLFARTDLVRHDIAEYMELIGDCVSHDFSGLIIDSVTHEWNGRQGVLSTHDALVAKKASQAPGKKVNSFATWGESKKPHNAFVDAFTSLGLVGGRHLICTVRSRMKHTQEADGRVTRIGIRPIQDKELLYEFDVAFRMDFDHRLWCTKSRFPEIDGKVFDPKGTPNAANPIENLGAILANLLTDNGHASLHVAAPAMVSLPPDLTAQLESLRREAGISDEAWRSSLAKRGVTHTQELTIDTAMGLRNAVQAKIAKQAVPEVTTTPPTSEEVATPSQDQTPIAFAKTSVVDPTLISRIQDLQSLLNLDFSGICQAVGIHVADIADLDNILLGHVIERADELVRHQAQRMREEALAKTATPTPVGGQTVESTPEPVPIADLSVSSQSDDSADDSEETDPTVIAYTELIARALVLKGEIGIPDDRFAANIAKRGVASLDEMPMDALEEFVGKLETLKASRVPTPAPAPSPSGLGVPEVAALISQGINGPVPRPGPYVPPEPHLDGIKPLPTEAPESLVLEGDKPTSTPKQRNRKAKAKTETAEPAA